MFALLTQCPETKGNLCYFLNVENFGMRDKEKNIGKREQLWKSIKHSLLIFSSPKLCVFIHLVSQAKTGRVQ